MALSAFQTKLIAFKNFILLSNEIKITKFKPETREEKCEAL